MSVKQLILCVISVLTVQFCGYAQQTKGGLAVRRDNRSLEKLLATEQKLTNDTDRVDLLNMIAGKYWYANTPGSLDSCTFFAKKADVLSQRIHFTAGRNEAVFLLCKSYTKSDQIRSAAMLIGSVYGEERVRLLLVAGEYYVFTKSNDQAIIRKAYPFILHAAALSDSLSSTYWRYQTSLLSGKYNFKMGALEKGVSNFMAIINDCNKNNDLRTAAHYWSELGTYLPETDTTFKAKTNYHQKAYELFLRANDKEDAAYSLRDAANLNMSHHQVDLALKQMLEVMTTLKSIGAKISSTSYWLLSGIYDLKGMYKEALYYGLQAIDVNDNRNEAGNPQQYLRLGYLYGEQKLHAKSSEYYKLALDGFVKTNNSSKYFCCYNYITEELALGHSTGAKAFLFNFIRQNQSLDIEEQELMAAATGNVYLALKEMAPAEVNFRKMIALDKAAVEQRKTAVVQTLHMQSSDAYWLFADFMAEKKQYGIAKNYLSKTSSTQQTLGAGALLNMEYQQFKVDSAMGNATSALSHYVRYSVMKDSLLNIEKSRQIAGLRLTFEAKQREQSIKLLKNQARVTHAELKRVSLQRNLTVGGIAVTCLLVILLYFFYKQKQVSNRQLQFKQDEINLQNVSLRQLVSDKNWLLKEVHHRVKNNLHIITSLLETQSSYLHNTAALEAIAESQSRIKAIALIHQRLYTESNLAVIGMRSYIHELVQYLKDSYDLSVRGITFTLLIDDLDCDVQQAIPIGLILNEAVTNAIKYAFPDKEGEVTISLREKAEARLEFAVGDNGIGLPAGTNTDRPASMGMGLIRGLTGQLGGILSISGMGGVIITVVFPKVGALAEHDESLGI